MVRAGLLPLALALLLPAAVRAGNGDDFFVGDRAAMTSGAVTATVSDGSAAFYNQAGLASVTRNKLDVSASAYGLRFYSVESFLAVEDGPSTDASVTEFVAIPTEVAYVRELGEGVSLGLGYFVPLSNNALLRERLQVSDDPGPASTWALDARVSTASYWLVTALGLRLSERVRLGFGLFGVYDDEVTSTSFFGSVEQDDLTDKALQLSTLGTASRISTAPGVGLQVDLARGLTLGLFARGPRLQLSSTAESSVSFVFAQSTLPLVAASDPVDESGRQVGLLSMGRYAVGLAYEFGATTLSIDGDVQPGLRNRKLDVDQAVTVNARLGVLHAITRTISLGAGVFTDRSTAPARATDSIDFYGGTLGIGFDDMLGLAEDEGADSLILSSVFALRYAYGTGQTDTFLVDPTVDVTDAIGDGVGDQTVHEFALHIGSGLSF